MGSFTHAELNRNNLQANNTTIVLSIFRWFSYGEFPVEVSRPASRDNSLTMTKANGKTMQILYYFVIPGAIFLIGLILLIRRKRK